MGIQEIVDAEYWDLVDKGVGQVTNLPHKTQMNISSSLVARSTLGRALRSR